MNSHCLSRILTTTACCWIGFAISCNEQPAQPIPQPVSEKPLPETLDPQAYQDEKYRFTIHVPRRYIHLPGQNNLAAFVFRNEAGDANINMQVEFCNNTNLEAIFRQGKNDLQNQVTDPVVHGEGDTIIGSQPAKWIELSHGTYGVSVRAIIYMTVRENYCFMIFYTAAEDKFENYRSEFRASAESLKFKTPNF